MPVAFAKTGVAPLVLVALLSACGNNMEQRVASGVLIGATGGAVLGGSMGSAALGALAGAGTGAVVYEVQKDKKPERRP